MGKLINAVTDAVINGVCFIYRDSSNPKLIDGFMLFSSGTSWWSDKKELRQLVQYVNPNKRNSKIFLYILRALQEYVIMTGTTPVVGAIGERKDRLKSVYEKMGFEVVGNMLSPTS